MVERMVDGMVDLTAVHWDAISAADWAALMAAAMVVQKAES